MEATTDPDRKRVMDASASPPLPTLTVAAVARRLGVAPPTLRTWDRRYGLGPSAHTAGAHRRYSLGDVARLMLMCRLTLEGVSPADAAAIAIATPFSADGQPISPTSTPADGFDITGIPDLPGPGPRSVPGDGGFGPDSVDGPEPVTLPGGIEASGGTAQAGTAAGVPGPGSVQGIELPGRTRLEQVHDDVVDLSDPSVLARLDRAGAGSNAAESPAWDEFERLPVRGGLGILHSVGPSEPGPAGARRAGPRSDGTPSSRGLARAAMSLDTYETGRILRDSIRRQGVVVTWNSMIMPVLRALGERTLATGDGIDVEHAFSEVILAVLRVLAYQRQSPSGGSPVLLACADADYHSLPLHALAASLAERDVPTRMLGCGLPPEALSASVRRTGPAAIVLFARMSGADAGPTEDLRRQRPAPTVILAGPGWKPETIPRFARSASSLTEAIDEVLRAIHA